MLILASKSPRREKILSDAGIKFIVKPSNVNEEIGLELAPEKLAVELAWMKAKHIANLYPNEIVIGADTIVAIDEKSLGKPKDEKDAYQILKLLSNRTHTVFTGVAIVKGDKVRCFVSHAIVTMRNLTDTKIKEYIKTKEPMDKAGAYGIQGEGGKLIKSYKGDFFTIMGLPLKKLLEELKRF